MDFRLNDGQERVATTLRGRVLVSAGAGTGKTRALTERFVRAVTSPRDGSPAMRADELLTITFTEKAAGEIAERIRTELRRRGCVDQAALLEGGWISTIHGFGRRILRRHAIESGVDPDFTVADTVVAGFLGDEALESALRAATARCPAGPSILDRYGADTVGVAVRAAAQALRTRGLGAAALSFEQVDESVELLSEALAVITEAEERLSPHVSGGKLTARSHAACGSARRELERLDPAIHSDEAIGRALWDALSTKSWPKATAKAVAEAAQELEEARENLARRALVLLMAPSNEEFGRVVADYLHALEELKAERALLDFDDLQLRAYELISNDDRLRERYRDAFAMVMVDEFQDTDEVQLGLVEALAGEDLCTVGDERQSIYAFRGADVEVYRRHREEMRRAGSVEVDLVENYRSHPDVIAFVNRVFGSPELFGSHLPGLVASREELQESIACATGPRVRIGVVPANGGETGDARSAESEMIAEQFERLRESGYASGDMVVLVRDYSKGVPVSDALERRGFDVEMVGGSRFFKVRSVKTLAALCSAIANPHDDAALARLLVSEMSGVSEEGALLLGMARKEEGGGKSLWDVFVRSEEILEGVDVDQALRLRNVLERARRRAAEGSLEAAVRGAFEDSGIDLIYASGGREGERAFENAQKLLRMIESFERSGGAGASAFVARLKAEERFRSTESPATVVSRGGSAIRIMSIHAAKGLEFPVVAMPFCADPPRRDARPWRLGASGNGVEFALKVPDDAKGSPKEGWDCSPWFMRLHEQTVAREISEVKRQFYVACTRAQEVLVLTGTVKVDKLPEEMAESPLAWCLRALDCLRPLPEASTEHREFDGVRTLELSVSSPPSDEPSGVPVVEKERPGEPQRESGAGEPARAPVTDEVVSIAPSRLSATDIALHTRCSLRYWAERVAGFGDASEASGGEDALAFGSALHSLLQLDDGELISLPLERIGAVARFHGLDAAGERRLKNALDVWSASSLRTELHGHRQVWKEYPFALQFTSSSAASFDLVGSIDAWGRSEDSALIVDYKSGVTEITEGESQERYAVQASVYAYAALREGCRDVRVCFVHLEVRGADGEPRQTEFRFGAADKGAIEASLIDTYHRIADEPYRALARWEGDVCGSCRIAESICPLRSGRSDVG